MAEPYAIWLIAQPSFFRRNTVIGKTTPNSQEVLNLSSAQEIDKAIPVLEKAAKISEDGETYVLLGNLYLSEDKLNKAVDAIQKGIKKGKLKKISQAHLTLGQAHYELQNFEEAKKQFRMAARDKDKKIKKTANSWIKYTENEESRAKNLELRRNYIKQS